MGIDSGGNDLLQWVAQTVGPVRMRSIGMSYLLCHTCYTWVEPRDLWCPDCDAPLDAGTPDPPLAILESNLGALEGALCGVRARRRRTVAHGWLLRTTTGLLFVPHQEPDMVSGGERRSWLHVFSIPFSGWRMPEVDPQHWGDTAVDFDDQSLGAILMEDPRAFFIHLRVIRQLRRHRQAWTIERLYGATVQLAPIQNSEALQQQMQQVLRLLEGPGTPSVVRDAALD